MYIIQFTVKSFLKHIYVWTYWFSKWPQHATPNRVLGRHLEHLGGHLGGIWRHLEASGGIWRASGRPLGGLWEASGGSARLASPAKPAGTKNVNISLKPLVFHWFYWHFQICHPKMLIFHCVYWHFQKWHQKMLIFHCVYWHFQKWHKQMLIFHCSY